MADNKEEKKKCECGKDCTCKDCGCCDECCKCK
jgi:hypothetical protein